MARWRAFVGKETLPGIETSKGNSKGVKLHDLYNWARRQVEELKPVNYKVIRLDASVYFQGQGKGKKWTQTLKEYDGDAFTKFLTLLQEKKKERDAKRGAVKEIWVDFDLFIQPDEHIRRGEGNILRRNPTERQLLSIPYTQAELFATKGQITKVVTY
jgi:hypothetical protein